MVMNYPRTPSQLFEGLRARIDWTYLSAISPHLILLLYMELDERLYMRILKYALISYPSSTVC